MVETEEAGVIYKFRRSPCERKHVTISGNSFTVFLGIMDPGNFNDAALQDLSDWWGQEFGLATMSGEQEPRLDLLMNVMEDQSDAQPPEPAGKTESSSLAIHDGIHPEQGVIPGVPDSGPKLPLPRPLIESPKLSATVGSSHRPSAQTDPHGETDQLSLLQEEVKRIWKE